jgi:hypothetical protein
MQLSSALTRALIGRLLFCVLCHQTWRGMTRHSPRFGKEGFCSSRLQKGHFRTVGLHDGEHMLPCHRTDVDQEGHCDRDDLEMYLCDTGLLFTRSFNTLNLDPESVYRSMFNASAQVLGSLQRQVRRSYRGVICRFHQGPGGVRRRGVHPDLYGIHAVMQDPCEHGAVQAR